MLFLFETAAGYALFKVVKEGKLEKADVSRCCCCAGGGNWSKKGGGLRVWQRQDGVSLRLLMFLV